MQVCDVANSSPNERRDETIYQLLDEAFQVIKYRLDDNS
jgi:hypothetical protein